MGIRDSHGSTLASLGKNEKEGNWDGENRIQRMRRVMKDGKV